jgi:hypothetical protein
MDSTEQRASLRIVEHEDGTFAVVDASAPVEEDGESIFYSETADGFESRAEAEAYIAKISQGRRTADGVASGRAASRQGRKRTMTANDNGTEAERHRLRYALLESYYVMDAHFAGDREAGGEILALIDDALCSENLTAMREALPLVTEAALPPTEDEEEHAAEDRAQWRRRHRLTEAESDLGWMTEGMSETDLAWMSAGMSEAELRRRRFRERHNPPRDEGNEQT